MIEQIASPQRTIGILQRYDFQFLKKYGQNFLIDLHVLDKILNVAEITEEDIVIEVGPGIGSLTQAIAERAGRVISVEIDNRLIPILEENLAEYPNVTIIQNDFLKIDLQEFVKEQGIDRPIKVIANLPYYITTPIIMNLLESGIPLASITVMVQEEVAKRMQAGPGTKDYGALSLAVQYYCEPYIAAYVPQNCFIPRPNVGSAVIHLRTPEVPRVVVQNPKLMFGLVKAAFGQRRKTLVNSVSNSPELTITKDQITEALTAFAINPQIRGEALMLEDFAKLSDYLNERL